MSQRKKTSVKTEGEKCLFAGCLVVLGCNCVSGSALRGEKGCWPSFC